MFLKSLLMKTILIAATFFMVWACGPESSPEGRSKIRDRNLQEQLDSLKTENIQMKKEILLIKEKLKMPVK